MLLKIRSQAIALVCLSALSTGRPSFAQSSAGAEAQRNFETRSQLEAQARLADLKQNKSEAYLIRYRLEHGDFQEGDRIIIRVVRGSTTFGDTTIVREGKKLLLSQMGELPLEGVLRSELVPRLTAHISKYVRDPFVEAKVLVRVGILGMVNRPGFYYAPPDLPLSDILMAAGGPNSLADLGRVLIRRDGDVIIDANNTRTAISSGMSMDFLHMQAGDEITVGQGRQIPWGIVLSAASAVLGLVLAYTSAHR
jgi:protein involved in polysaccharide export with SLBB domain